MIVLLAYLSLGFLGLRFLVVGVNFLFHFTPGKFPCRESRKISVLIPARNEEKHMARILDCLLKQDYKNLEVLVCDDHSTDSTALILEEYSQKHPEITWFKGDNLKPGWTGKNYACHQLAGKAKGEILLFLDADMEIHGDIISCMAGYMKKNRLALLSIFPKQILMSRGERATVPVMNWILLSLLPLPLVHFSKRRSFSAANGQFMMFKGHVYHKLQPHAIVRSSPVEDIEIMRLYKKNAFPCATVLGDLRVQCRMYSSYNEAIQGFSKNVLHFFSGRLIWTLFYILFTSFGLLFIALWSLPYFFPALGVAILSRVLIALASHQNVVLNLLMVPLQHISFLRMVSLALIQKSRGNLEWKGRKIEL
ncbi:MAG: glycosyltransferase family 2 protein [Bacteroidales bacterium]|nr:glycosyltransferase family 2 protein [Bacteroidales bacterium]